MNIVSEVFFRPPTVDAMVMEEIYIGKSFQTWEVSGIKKEMMRTMVIQTGILLH